MVAIGGDGAPFGKWDESMSFLVSFLNVGSKVAGPNDNFLLFGANCKETHQAVIAYIKLLSAQIEAVTQKTYTVANQEVFFTCELVPSDMKFLAFLNEELNNASHYFSRFANVSKADSDTEFGKGTSCKWKPWVYSERVTVAKNFDFKRKLKPNLAQSTKRNRVTQFISSNKSRRIFTTHR